MKSLSALATWISRNWKSLACLVAWVLTLAVGKEYADAWMANNAGLLATISAIIGTLLPMMHKTPSATTRR